MNAEDIRWVSVPMALTSTNRSNRPPRQFVVIKSPVGLDGTAEIVGVFSRPSGDLPLGLSTTDREQIPDPVEDRLQPRLTTEPAETIARDSCSDHFSPAPPFS